ncbi:MAG: hypothetical protein ABJE95_35795 [Byssovorax sp.]
MDLPAELQLRWLLRRTAMLLELGAEPVNGLILPTGEFFPDKFDGSPAGFALLMGRIQRHAGLGDLPVELMLITPEGEAQTVSCASGACGGGGKIDTRLDRVIRRDDGSYAVAISVAEAKNPTVLTTTLVRSVAAMFMIESGAYEGLIPADREPTTDLAAVLLGFGVIVANGSYIYMKGCSGVSVHSATRMPVDEVTVALALFCKLHRIEGRTAARYLELTPREHLDEGLVWASSNGALVEMLREAPAKIEADTYSIAPARSWLARVLGGLGGKKKADPSSDDDLDALERAFAGAPAVKRLPADAAKARKLAELRALVDESLEG